MFCSYFSFSLSVLGFNKVFRLCLLFVSSCISSTVSGWSFCRQHSDILFFGNTRRCLETRAHSCEGGDMQRDEGCDDGGCGDDDGEVKKNDK